jgi:hypothetical protein
MADVVAHAIAVLPSPYNNGNVRKVKDGNQTTV